MVMILVVMSWRRHPKTLSNLPAFLLAFLGSLRRSRRSCFSLCFFCLNFCLGCGRATPFSSLLLARFLGCHDGSRTGIGLLRRLSCLLSLPLAFRRLAGSLLRLVVILKLPRCGTEVPQQVDVAIESLHHRCVSLGQLHEELEAQSGDVGPRGGGGLQGGTSARRRQLARTHFHQRAEVDVDDGRDPSHVELEVRRATARLELEGEEPEDGGQQGRTERGNHDRNGLDWNLLVDTAHEPI